MFLKEKSKILSFKNTLASIDSLKERLLSEAKNSPLWMVLFHENMFNVLLSIKAVFTHFSAKNDFYTEGSPFPFLSKNINETSAID
jgi:hypothetical protein